MGNALDRIRGINAQISALELQIDQVEVEAEILRHIDDDAQRDAAVSENYDDRAAAKMTQSDIARMDKHIHDLERTHAKLVKKRDRLIRKLAAK